MPFITKLDFSDNRQAKQRIETIQVLSGATHFGVPFNTLPSGPDLSTTAVTETHNLLYSTFTGTTGTTTYFWSDTRMSLAYPELMIITPLNSGTTQTTGPVLTASSTTTIDGNTIALAYTGVSFDLVITNMIPLGGGIYSGSLLTNTLNILSASTFDFKGRTIWVDVSGITRTNNLIVTNIGATPSTNSLYWDSVSGLLTTATSDERLKTNIKTLTNSLNKIKNLRGVSYNWIGTDSGTTRIGFIAQEVNSVVPELTFTNPNSPEGYMGVHYDNVTALLVEAVKELSLNIISSVSYLETQSILAEDNDIQLNYSGTNSTSVGGGVKVLHALGEGKAAELITDLNGDWTTNNLFKPFGISLPIFTPSGSTDISEDKGNITIDENYLYIKTSSGWKRSNLESF